MGRVAMNKQERVYRILRQRILDGGYAPGDRLVIDRLARELGVSPLPVREAIRRLEAEGWVVFRPHAGARVAPLDPARWEAVMDVLAVLEGRATALVSGRLETGDLARLDELNRAMAEAAARGDLVEAGECNRAFHFTIYARCPNPYLTDLLRAAWERLDSLRRAIFPHIPGRVWESVAEHQQLIALLAAGADPAKVEALARAHKLRTVEAFRQAHAAPTKEVASPS